MSPGLLGNEGERYQRRGDPLRAPGVMLDSTVSSSGRGHWTLVHDENHREESADVRRTAAIIATGALLFLTGCSGDDGPGGSDAARTTR